MDRRTVLAIVLCFLIYMGWQKFYVEPHVATQTTTAPATTQTSGAPTTGGSTVGAGKPAAPSEAVPTVAAQTLALATSTGDAVIGNGAQFLETWNLKGYTLGMGKETGAVDLRSVTHEDAGEVALNFEDPAYSYLAKVRGKLAKTPNGALWTYEDKSVKLTREIVSSPELPYLDIKVTADFKGKRPNFAFLSLGTHSPEKDPEAQDRQLIYFTNQSIERVTVKDADKAKEVVTPVKYVGTTTRYFLMSLIGQGPLEAKGLVEPLQSSGRVSLVYPIAGNSITLPFRAYFGPKELDVLRKVEPTLDHAIDFGWFTFFAYPLLKLLKWLYQFVHNYGVAIILLTLLIKVVTFPLNYKSMKSMKEMAKLQPQLQKIREKYKDDKEALNREMLSVMKTHGYNPMAGCLPMLIQMPIFFALYRVLYSSIELYHAPFALWIHDLSHHDPFYVTPVLLSLTMFVQQKLTPQTATDPAQQKMLQLMPLIFGAFMLTLPSGLTLYMLVNAVASIVQQLILNKKLDTRHVQAVAARAR